MDEAQAIVRAIDHLASTVRELKLMLFATNMTLLGISISLFVILRVNRK